MPDLWTAVTYSDDCLSFEHNGKGVGPDEYDTWGKWWPVIVDGVHVADIMLDCNGDWDTSIRSVGDHSIGIDFIDNPEHVDGCRCDECDP